MNSAKKGHKAAEFAIILLFFGLALLAAAIWLLTDASVKLFKDICFYGGIGFCAISILILVICIAKAVPRRKKAKQQKPNQVLDLSDGNADTVPQDTVIYVPSSQAQNFVEMGSHQTVEQKFEQIGKMDKTQFVIYVARLFSRKGYQVKLTPVFDNYNIDMLVEKMGVTIAVGCVLTNKILGEEDIKKVAEGKAHYNVSNVMTLTNMYFDRTALDFAKVNKISLVDRVILTEDFMD